MTNDTPAAPAPLQAQDFEPSLDAEFTISLGEERGIVCLTELKLLKNHAPDTAFRAPFSLIFKSSVPQVWPQGLYTLDCARMGAIEIFLVPIGQDASGVSYEAVFS